MKGYQIKTDIIPVKTQFYSVSEMEAFDFKAICIFAAIGFFLDQDTYYTSKKAMRPGHKYEFDENGSLKSYQAWFDWHYEPRSISLNEATNEFAELFESIVAEQSLDQKVILPLSGGLDSRTQAAALFRLGNRVNSYSYEFQGGRPEIKYGKAIAEVCSFSFKSWQIPKGYLWPVLTDLATLNKCYADFIHPRQMAFSSVYAEMGDCFSLGHWGDVLFDDMGVPNDLSLELQVEALLKKILKKGGQELAETLWQAWGLQGQFIDYFRSRLYALLSAINIDDANARIRAFKSLYWAPRWTSVNLAIFEQAQPIHLPYYSNEICQFICGIPERHLARRQIQIEYLKQKAPQLARIPWQPYDPYNLYNFPEFRRWKNVPRRALRYFHRKVKHAFGHYTITSNWQLQFLGKENEIELKKRLLNNKVFTSFLPQKVVNEFLDNFTQKDPVKYSHPISMLLTLSQFCQLSVRGR